MNERGFHLSSLRQWRDYEELIGQINLDLAASPVNLPCPFFLTSFLLRLLLSAFFSFLEVFLFPRLLAGDSLFVFYPPRSFISFSFISSPFVSCSFNSNLWIGLI